MSTNSLNQNAKNKQNRHCKKIIRSMINVIVLIYRDQIYEKSLNLLEIFNRDLSSLKLQMTNGNN